MTTRTRKKHLGLWWLVLVLGLTNLAIFLEANPKALSEPVAAATSTEEVAPASGSVAGHVASISVTIGTGLIILGASIIWVTRFVKDLAATKPSATTSAAPKATTKTSRPTGSTKSAKTARTSQTSKTVKIASRSGRKSPAKPKTAKTKRK